MDYLAVSRAKRPYNWRTRPGPHRQAGRGFYISPIVTGTMWLARFSSSTVYRTLQQQTADVVNQRRTLRSWFFVCLIQPDGTEPL